jgi:uncharacterized membrane protein YczE/cytidylate kinase
MKKEELIRRYVVFIAALLVSAFGVSLVTRSALGTSPISSIPYVLSLNTPLTMGAFTFLLNMILIGVQMGMLGRKGIRARRMDLLLQIPVSVVFSAFIDLTMALLAAFHPDFYLWKVVSLVIGCGILAFGIGMEVLADVTMLSGEYTVQIAAARFKKEFGKCKMGFDCTLVALAAVSAFLLSGHLEGVREGTVVAALITGPFVKYFSRYMGPFRAWILRNGAAADAASGAAAPSACRPLVITIAREYGSGGHALGQQIAQRLGIAFYDEELPEMISRECALSTEEIQRHEQSLYPNLLLRMLTQDYEASLEKSLGIDDTLFVATEKVVKRLAEAGDCVIVGRCADWILRDYPGCLHLFVHADSAYKVARATAEYGLPVAHAAEAIDRINRFRAAHYEHYTGRGWRDIRHYHLVCDTSLIPHDQLVATIATLYQARKQEQG